MPGLHWPELVALVVIALLFFGPKRLPEIGSSIGKTIKEFQKSMREVTEPDRPDKAATPPALPQADAQTAPQTVTPAQNPVVSASATESSAE